MPILCFFYKPFSFDNTCLFLKIFYKCFVQPISYNASNTFKSIGSNKYILIVLIKVSSVGVFFKCWQIGQSYLLQFFQWLIICLDEEQWGVGQDFPNWQDVKWVSILFMVLQWGNGHWRSKFLLKCESKVWVKKAGQFCCFIS